MFNFNPLRLVSLLLKFSILAIFFLVPLVFDPAYFLYNNFILPKSVIFFTLTGLLVFSTFLHLLFLKNIKISRSLLKTWLWPGLLLLALSLSSLLSVNFFHSWQGSYERLAGLDFYLALFLWLVLISFNIYQNKNLIKAKEIFLTIALSSLLVSIYAVSQFFGFDFMSWKESAEGYRAFSTLGQPNYLGLFLLLSWPTYFYLIFKSRSKVNSIFIGLALLLNLLALVLSFSRGSWLAFLLIFIAFLWWLAKKKNIFKPKKILLGGLIILAFLAFLSSNSMLKDRLNNFFSGPAVSVRWLHFQAAGSKFIDKPILGHGLEHQDNLFRSDLNKKWALYEKLNIYMDRAHNVFLDYLVVGGALGLIFFVLWVYKLFQQVYFLDKDRKYFSPATFFAWGILGVLVALQFTFETITSQVYLWGLAGFIAVWWAQKKDSDLGREVLKDNFFFRLNVYIKALMVLLAFFLLIFCLYFQVNRLSADHYFRSSLSQLQKHEYPASMLLYEYAVNLKDLPKYHRDFAQQISYVFIENRLPVFRELELKLKEIASKLGPGYRNYLAKAYIYQAVKDYDKSEYFYFQTIDIAPNYYQPYLEIARFYKNIAKYDLAKDYYLLALDRLPNLSNSKMAISHKPQLITYNSLIYRDLGETEFLQGNYFQAIELFKQAYTLKSHPQTLKKIADSYFALDDYDMAIEYNLEGQENYSDDPAWPTALASLYELQGDKDLAQQSLERALVLDPEYEPALSLKKLLSSN
ncbi:MAG: O-antigen ligase family protein [Candidatus Pacebacteria bacterium]|nr:O-antigen ligase family protein [Candidatus Paceibacterota bacterium]